MSASFEISLKVKPWGATYLCCLLLNNYCGNHSPIPLPAILSSCFLHLQKCETHWSHLPPYLHFFSNSPLHFSLIKAWLVFLPTLPSVIFPQNSSIYFSRSVSLPTLPSFSPSSTIRSCLFTSTIQSLDSECLYIYKAFYPSLTKNFNLKLKVMRTPRNIFLVNLALSDLLLCSFTIPATLADSLTNFWQIGEEMVNITATLIN